MGLSEKQILAVLRPDVFSDPFLGSDREWLRHISDIGCVSFR
jgi:hypothetical protein